MAAQTCRPRILDADRGSVAAELAIALPAALLVLALCVGALAAAATQVCLQDAAADAARRLSRGESQARATRAVTDVVDGSRVAAHYGGELICVTAAVDLRVGTLIRVPLTASSCALNGGL